MSVDMAVHVFMLRSRRCSSRLVTSSCRRRDFRTGSDVLLLTPLHEACTGIVNQKRKEQSSHEDGCCGTFILELTQTLIAKHQVRVSKEVDESGRDNNASAKLLQNDENDVVLRDQVEASG